MAYRISLLTNRLNQNLNSSVRQHLRNVYATFTVATVAAAIGAAVVCRNNLFIITALVGSSVCLRRLQEIPYDGGKNQRKRLTILITFCFLIGFSLGPLIDEAIAIDPNLLVKSLLASSIVFACFSLAALGAPRGYYLYLGGTILSLLSTICIFSLINLFIVRSQLIFELNLYLELIILCGFITYDTQIIIEQVSDEKDYIIDALLLFYDFVVIFKSLLKSLIYKEKKKKKNKR